MIYSNKMGIVGNAVTNMGIGVTKVGYGGFLGFNSYCADALGLMDTSEYLWHKAKTNWKEGTHRCPVVADLKGLAVALCSGDILAASVHAGVLGLTAAPMGGAVGYLGIKSAGALAASQTCTAYAIKGGVVCAAI